LDSSAKKVILSTNTLDVMSSDDLKILAIGTASGELLPGGNLHCESSPTISTGLERLAQGNIDLILLEFSAAPDWSLEAFAWLHGEFLHVPIVLVTEPAHEELARKALLLGAQDYVYAAELPLPALTTTIQKAVLRHRSQNISRRDRHLLEILMQKIPDGIYFKDTESRFLRISRAQAKKFNLSDPAAAVGKTDADFFSAAHAQQALADEQESMRTGQPLVDFEEKETWPDGSVTWVSTTKMPLRNRTGEIIGTFGISRDITPRKVAELALAERTAQLQQKNQQIEEELRMARELQLAMLPQKSPALQNGAGSSNAVEFFSFFLPSGTVSGDFFDIIKLSDTAIAAFVCDVMGHDVRAALVTAMLRSLVKDLSHAGIDPGKLLGQLNSALAAVFRQTGATMFATAFYVVIDVSTGEIRYASGAHPDALYLQGKHGRVEPLMGKSMTKGPALGLFDEAVFPTCRRQVEAGDFILLFTDGLVESANSNQECYSQERLAQAIHRSRNLPAGELMKAIIDEARAFCGNGEFGDDVCLVGLKVNELLPSATASRIPTAIHS
jgi:sigma-B regulation protein RsbU (phosphoserine phosphatase)